VNIAARLSSSTPRIVLRASVLSGLSAVGLASTYFVAVRTVRGQFLDLLALSGQKVEPQRLVSSAGTLLGTISVASVAAAFVGVVAVGLLRNRRRVGLIVAGILFGAVSTTEVLKRVILTRPELVRLSDLDVAVNTLPSGHSTAAMSVVIAVILLVPKRFQFLASIFGAPYAVGIGIATVVVHWHRPSDVVAAWFVVAGWTFLGLALLRLTEALQADEPASWGRHIGPGLVALVAAATSVLMVTTVIGLTAHLPKIPDVEHRAALKSAFAFGFSLASIAAVGMTFIGTLLWVLRDSVLTEPGTESCSCPQTGGTVAK
jgi:membrane-associated phospholipid phosphatase